MKADFHMHTRFSSDSDTAPEEIVEKAIEIGLETICFTDHFDKDYPGHENEFQLDTPNYFPYMQKIQEEYKDRIDIRIGVELGMQPHLGDFLREYVKQYPFDFVIGSMHLFHGQDPYYKKCFVGRTDREAYKAAFEETLETIKRFSGFDVLGHLDFIVRYGKRQAEEYSYEENADVIDEILKYLITNGKGLELNTAGWKYGLSFAHPYPSILKRYRELGGEIITVGSDGHRPEHIAYDFHKVNDLLKACGFKYYTEFKQRKPVFCALI
ncbi:MAG: histidinol-phosphatase HisJ family protein [Tyzzerella sp.]|nr:histidinol-phosphatase HisJ family protein [Tyzzerella sp.]